MYRGYAGRVVAGSLSSVKTGCRTLSRCYYVASGRKTKKTKRMQKCSLSRERKTEKGSTPKCNIPRRQTISSEIESTLEICNALEEKKKKLISADTSIFHGRRADILWKRKERSNTFDEGEDAVNFSRYFYTNLYLAITDRFSTFSRTKGRRCQLRSFVSLF